MWLVAGVPVVIAPNWWAALSFAAIVTLSCLLWQAKDAPSTPHDSDPERPGNAPPHSWPTFLGHILPVWRRQADTIRLQTEEAMGTLLESLAAILNRVGTSGIGTPHAGDSQATQELLRQCELKLNPVIGTMTGMAASKEQLSRSMRDLGRTAEELNTLVDDVAKLAQQTNLLSLNAAIEAARAGEHGRGFAVVAAEVRRLSMDSASTANRIRERICDIGQIMTKAGEEAVKTAQAEEQEIKRTSDMVREVVDHVHQLGSNAEQLATESQEILRNVESLVMGLQFQDRVAQAVDILNQDIQRLEGKIAQAAPIPDVEPWLHDLHSKYTMREQRVRHADETLDIKAPPSQQAAVFF